MTKKAILPKPIPVPISEEPVSSNPLVFISHDTRDAELAEAFSQLLSNSSMGILESFRSSDKRGAQGIEYGTLWYDEILKKLNDASDVVCLLTNHSIDRPWILYEAGIAIGKSNTPLIGIALGIPLNKANNGPFAQFQNCADDLDSLTKLICSLVKKIPNAKPVEDVVKGQVQQFIDKIKSIIEAQPIQIERTDTPAVEDTQTAKLFEEIKIMFQDLPSRIEKNSFTDGNRKSRRLHPMMLEELMHTSKDASTGFLIILSLFKNDFPWLYELGTELSRHLKTSKPLKDKDLMIHEFERVVQMSTHNPYFEEMFMRNKDDYRLYREMPQMLLNALRRMVENKYKE
jgi:hypothetical protein